MSTIKVRDRAHWLSMRASNIGGSQIASVCGVSPWQTRFELFHEKARALAGVPPPEHEQNEAMFWGSVLEGAIAEGIRQRCGLVLRHVDDYHLHPSVPGMGASLDYEILDDPRGPGALEIKTVDRAVFARDWTEDSAPLYYELQLMHELACTGWSWGLLAALVGGNDLRLYERVRHPSAIARIEQEVIAFWESVRANKPPQPDWEADAKTINDLYRVADSGVMVQFKDEDGDVLTGLCAAYEESRKTHKVAELRRDGLKAQILHMIGTAEVALSPEWEIRAGTTKDSEVLAHVRKGHRRCDVRRRRDVRKLPPIGPVPHPELLNVEIDE